jgi:hypothetical protein
MSGEGEAYRVTLRPVGDGPPVAVRLRHLLKLALRACGLRCLAVEKIAAGKPARGKTKPAASSPRKGPAQTPEAYPAAGLEQTTGDGVDVQRVSTGGLET